MTQIIIWALVLVLLRTNGGILRGSLTSDPREARAEGSQLRDQRSRLHLREFARNSRIFAAFAPGANRAPQFFFPRKSGSQNSAGIRCADTPSAKGDPKL